MMQNININELPRRERANYLEGVNLSPPEKAERKNDFPSNELPRPTCFHRLSYLFRGGYRRHAVAKLCFKLKLHAILYPSDLVAPLSPLSVSP